MNTETNFIIADDQAWFRKNLINLLKDYQIRAIGEASNGLEVIELLKIEVPDILILDIEMPVMNGNQTMQYLNKHYPALKVLILSGYQDETLIMNYLTRGARGFLHKNSIQNPFQFANTILDITESGFCKNDLPKHALKFTEREIEIIPILTEGKTSKEIAKVLKTTERAINKHRDNIYKKCKVRNLGEFINSAVKKGYEFLSQKSK
jgi:DNA-binding NarL/FixJ family response regulator